METVRHISPECGQPAMYAKRVPHRGELIVASDFEHLDGRPVNAGEPMVCDSCGRALGGVGRRNSELVAG